MSTALKMQLDYALATRPHPDEDVCGDAGLLKVMDNDLFIALIDGLGHGPDAQSAAVSARKYLESASRKSRLIDVMQGLHEHLRRSRGAVVALCRFETKTRMLKYVGVGNITVKLYAPKPITFVPRDGIVGYMMSTLREETLILSPKTVLVLHSDGLPAHLDMSNELRSSQSTAQEIAERLLNDFVKNDDDGSCIVVKVE